jgi:hypothetical protein
MDDAALIKAGEILSAHYFTAFDGVAGDLASDGVPPTPFEQANIPSVLRRVTLCVIRLRDGSPVMGEAICPEGQKYDEEKAREFAFRHALTKANCASKVSALIRSTQDDGRSLETSESEARPPESQGELAPHQQRIILERNQLFDRLQKLHTFMWSSQWFDLSPDEQKDLTDQHSAMVAYSYALQRRIARFLAANGHR